MKLSRWIRQEDERPFLWSSFRKRSYQNVDIDWLKEPVDSKVAAEVVSTYMPYSSMEFKRETLLTALLMNVGSSIAIKGKADPILESLTKCPIKEIQSLIIKEFVGKRHWGLAQKYYNQVEEFIVNTLDHFSKVSCKSLAILNPSVSDDYEIIEDILQEKPKAFIYYTMQGARDFINNKKKYPRATKENIIKLEQDVFNTLQFEDIEIGKKFLITINNDFKSFEIKYI